MGEGREAVDSSHPVPPAMEAWLVWPGHLTPHGSAGSSLSHAPTSLSSGRGFPRPPRRPGLAVASASAGG